MKNIIFDFDGVILNSNKIREYGFREIFKIYNKSYIDKLIEYHKDNGGLSRYHKIEYFYKNILKRNITQDKILKYAQEYSVIMRKNLPYKSNIIKPTINFIKKNNKRFNFHIASGSDEEELRFLCKKLNIDIFFKTIEGSPRYKNYIVELILKKEKYKKEETILIGDSKNDYNAAVANGIIFVGYNNKDLKDNSSYYIDNYDSFLKEIDKGKKWKKKHINY